MEQSGATFSNIHPDPHSGATSGGFGLGDAIHALTASLGIRECEGCAKRREYFNRLWRMSRSKDPLQRYILLRGLHGQTADTPPQ